jgi:predicted secreted Zn-dependent protease
MRVIGKRKCGSLMVEQAAAIVRAKNFGQQGASVNFASRLGLSIFATFLATATARAEGQIIEREEAYAVAGKTGIALYTSIGERGPVIGGKARTIAHTNFRLTWSRDYRPREGGACTLASARPKLIITYTLPKPAEKLPAATQKRWDAFIDGIRLHEKAHGDFIKEMVARIEKSTIGVSVPDDPKCQKIRKEIQKPLSEASLEQRRRSRDFDRDEMGKGGNIQRLILDLVVER